jgi:hypothetical protein
MVSRLNARRFSSSKCVGMADRFANSQPSKTGSTRPRGLGMLAIIFLSGVVGNDLVHPSCLASLLFFSFFTNLPFPSPSATVLTLPAGVPRSTAITVQEYDFVVLELHTVQ